MLLNNKMTDSFDISQQFYNNLKKFIQTKIKNPEDVNDILQDSLYKAQKNIHLLKQNTKFNSWLYQIVRNSIIDFYRKQRINFNIDELNIQDEDKGIDENDNNELTKCLKPLLNKLPEKYRNALELTELNEMSQTELSNHLSLTKSGTKSRVQRAKKKLHDVILECCSIYTDSYGNILDHKCKKHPQNSC